MNKFKCLTISAAALLALAIVGCNKADNANTAANNANKSATNANAASNSNAATDVANTKTDSGSVSLATPTDTYKAAYNYRKNKDIAGLKKVMSQDILDFLKMMGEDDKKSLDDTLKELCDRPQAATAESRNEKITGDTATIEYLDENGSWKTMDFEKIGTDWKMGAPKGAGKPEAPPKK